MADPTDFRQLVFKKGAPLLEEGKNGDAVYLIKSGRVEVRKGVRRDYPQLLGIRGPGDILGEMAMFDDRPHMATAIALEDTTVLVMSRDEFQRQLEPMAPIMKATIRVIVKRAREMADLLLAKPDPVNWRKWKSSRLRCSSSAFSLRTT